MLSGLLGHERQPEAWAVGGAAGEPAGLSAISSGFATAPQLLPAALVVPVRDDPPVPRRQQSVDDEK